MALRQNSTTRSQIANGNVGALANFLNTSTVTGQGGGLYTKNGFPQNFFVTNPQFGSVNYNDNSTNSTYHSLQLQTTKRLSRGSSGQFTYTFSKALDVSDGDGVVSPRDPNNRDLEKGRAGFDRTHIFSSNGTYELPFGPGRALLSNAPVLIQRLTERWQFGAIFSYSSGGPQTITAPLSTVWQSTASNTPVVLGAIPKGKVYYTSNGVNFFEGLTQIKDPSVAGVSSANSLSGSFSNLAIADAKGNPILVNPGPGSSGNLGRNTFTGPGSVGLDVNMLKRVTVTENKTFEVRVDVVNVLNHPNFGNPTLNINSVNFGRISSASGSRRFTLNARFNF
jgi:hypothetical protein